MSSFSEYCLVAAATYYIVSLIQAALHVLTTPRRYSAHESPAYATHHSDLLCSASSASTRHMEDQRNLASPLALCLLATGWAGYLVLPNKLFVVHVLVLTVSFLVHVYLHAHYHTSHSWLNRYRWFRRRRLLHALQHRYAGRGGADNSPREHRPFAVLRLRAPPGLSRRGIPALFAPASSRARIRGRV